MSTTTPTQAPQPAAPVAITPAQFAEKNAAASWRALVEAHRKNNVVALNDLTAAARHQAGVGEALTASL